jgi:hypothetical protein
MYKLGYQHGYTARETGRGMCRTDPEYVSGFQAGYAVKQAETMQHASRLDAAAALAWTDHLNVSSASSGHLAWAVEFSGTDWACYWSNGRTRKCIGHRPSRETAKALCTVRLARAA